MTPFVVKTSFWLHPKIWSYCLDPRRVTEGVQNTPLWPTLGCSSPLIKQSLWILPQSVSCVISQQLAHIHISARFTEAFSHFSYKWKRQSSGTNVEMEKRKMWTGKIRDQVWGIRNRTKGFWGKNQQMGKRSELCLVQQGRRKDDQLLVLRPLMVVHIEQSQPCSTNWKQILNIEMKLFCCSDFFGRGAVATSVY